MSMGKLGNSYEFYWYMRWKRTVLHMNGIFLQRRARYADDTIGTQGDQRYRLSGSVQGKFQIGIGIPSTRWSMCKIIVTFIILMFVTSVYSRGGTSGLSSKCSRSFFSLFCARFAESSVIFRKSRMSVDGPISRKARREVTGGRTVITFVSRSLDFFFLVDSSFLTIVVHGVKRAIVIAKPPVVVFRWTLLLSTDISQGRVNCRILPFMVTRT